jgi:hypothetical protein
LESKRGALRELGEEFPDEKLEELFEEQIEDAKMDGSKQILKSMIAAFIMEATGIVPDGQGEPVEPDPPPTKNADGSTSPAPERPKPMAETMDIGKYLTDAIQGGGRNLMADIVTRAVSPRVPLRRDIDRNDNEDAAV